MRQQGDFLDGVMGTVTRVEDVATDLVARIAPWVAPAPTAYLVFAKTTAHLGWPVWVGLTAAVVLESLGLAIAATALDLYRYNAGKRKSDPGAPLGLPLALVGLYFVAAELLTVALDVAPKLASRAAVSLADWAPAIFPVLSLAGVATLALRADHRRRVAGVAAAKRERSERRSGGRAGGRTKTGQVGGQGGAGDRAGAGSLGSLERANEVRRLNREDALSALVAFLSENPGASHREAGREVGRSKSWVTGAIGDLREAGRLGRNGD